MNSAVLTFSGLVILRWETGRRVALNQECDGTVCTVSRQLTFYCRSTVEAIQIKIAQPCVELFDIHPPHTQYSIRGSWSSSFFTGTSYWRL